MSSGWTTEQDREFFYKAEAAKIPKYNSALKLFWWGWGETDIARANGLAWRQNCFGNASCDATVSDGQ